MSASAAGAGTVAERHRRPTLGARLRHRMAALAGALGWPILQRELRADLRQSRFLMTHSLTLCLLGTVVLVLVAAHVEDLDSTPTQIGRSLFGIFFDVQFLVILFVFPAFSSTAFSEERSRETLDLLLTTTMRPREIVWGKFLSSSFYCLLYVLASIPLMAVSFLFGGVTPVEVITAYGLLVALTLVVSMLGVCISSCFESSLRSTLAMYTIVFAFAVLSILYYRSAGASLGGDRPVVRIILEEELGWGGDGFLAAFVASVVLVATVFLYLFLISVNRVRPQAHNRATALRVLTLASASGVLGFSSWAHWTAGSGDPGTPLLVAFPVLVAISWIFPTEEAGVSRRNRRVFDGLIGWRFPLRVFGPGAFWGLVYAWLTTGAIAAGLLVLWRLAPQSAVGGPPDPIVERIITESLLTLPFYLAAFAAAGYVLAAFDFSPLYSRLTAIFVFVITALLPVIFALTDREDAVWTFYYLSPITLWQSLQPDQPPDSPIVWALFGWSNVHVAKALFGAVALGLLVVGLWRARRVGQSPFKRSSDR